MAAHNLTRYPPDTPEKQKKLGAFFGKFPPPTTAGNVPAYVKAVKEKNPSLTKFGILGVSRESSLTTEIIRLGSKILLTDQFTSTAGAARSLLWPPRLTTARLELSPLFTLPWLTLLTPRVSMSPWLCWHQVTSPRRM